MKLFGSGQTRFDRVTKYGFYVNGESINVNSPLFFLALTPLNTKAVSLTHCLRKPLQNNTTCS